MTKSASLFFDLLILSIILEPCSSGLVKCVLKKLQNCHPNGKDAWKYNVTINTVDDKQYIDGTMTFERNLDNTIWFNSSIQRLTNDKYLYLFSFQEHKACDAMSKIFGEFLYDLERMGQGMSKSCPIQKGTYHWHNSLLQLDKIPTLSSFPFGTLLVITQLYERNNGFYACSLIEADLHM